MKVWYYGACDECKEAMTIYVSNPGCSAHYLEDYDEYIQTFLERHYECTIRLIHLDTDLAELWDSYTIFDYKTGLPGLTTRYFDAQRHEEHQL